MAIPLFWLDVECNAPTHGEKSALIAKLHQADRGHWEAKRQGWSSGGAPAPMTLIDRDEVSAFPSSSLHPPPNLHRHFEFACRLCGLKVTCRGETLDPLLDAYVAHVSNGAPAWRGAIELSVVAAMVHR